MERLESAIVALAALVAVGCSTIGAARRAQRAAEPAASGEQAAVGRVSLAGRGLAGLVDFALTNRPQIVRSRLAVEDERLALRALAADAPLASSTPWTALTASVGAGFGGSESSQDFREAKRIHGGTASASLSLDLLIWDFGRYNARASAQRERVLAAELDLAAAGYTVYKEVVDTYGKEGLKSQGYLDYYQNGKLAKSVLIRSDNYSPQKRIILRGTKTSPLTRTP